MTKACTPPTPCPARPIYRYAWQVRGMSYSHHGVKLDFRFEADDVFEVEDQRSREPARTRPSIAHGHPASPQLQATAVGGGLPAPQRLSPSRTRHVAPAIAAGTR